MANPLVDQGVLNRVKGSIVWAANPGLNVTASFLGKEGIRLALEGESSTRIPTLTGVVQSPEVYMAASITINLLRTQALSDLYKKRMESNALVGACTVRPDISSGGLSPYQFINCAIASVDEVQINGEVAGYTVRITCYYLVNSTLWD